MANPEVYFRANGSNSIGLGHLVRSSALADMIRDDFKTTLVVRDDIDQLILDQVRGAFTAIITMKAGSPDEECMFLNSILQPQDILVLDGYQFDSSYQSLVRTNGNLLVSIDDVLNTHFFADVVINSAGGLLGDEYDCEWYTRICTGEEFMLLRRPFWSSINAPVADNSERHKNVLISLGGADPDNATCTVLSACLTKEPGFRYQVVVGAAFKHIDELTRQIQLSDKVTIHQNLSANEMFSLIQHCGKAITSPSTVSYEYLSVGGELYLYPIAANQQFMYAHMVGKGLASGFENFPGGGSHHRITSRFDYNLRTVFNDLKKEASVTLRTATPEDGALVYHWFSDPSVRAQSYNSNVVSLDEHLAWYHGKLASSESFLFIAQIGQMPAGQIRFDLDAGIATISYLVDEAHRGAGLGRIIIKKGIQQLLHLVKTHSIHGFVKNANQASARSFQSLGFKPFTTSAFEDSTLYILNLLNAKN